MRDTASAPLWQRNYYEHIVRDAADLNRIRAYIERNPARWPGARPRENDNPVINRPSYCRIVI
jgi:hypothetical protein